MAWFRFWLFLFVLSASVVVSRWALFMPFLLYGIAIEQATHQQCQEVMLRCLYLWDVASPRGFPIAVFLCVSALVRSTPHTDAVCKCATMTGTAGLRVDGGAGSSLITGQAQAGWGGRAAQWQGCTDRIVTVWQGQQMPADWGRGGGTVCLWLNTGMPASLSYPRLGSLIQDWLKALDLWLNIGMFASLSYPRLGSLIQYRLKTLDLCLNTGMWAPLSYPRHRHGPLIQDWIKALDDGHEINDILARGINLQSGPSL